MHTPLVKMWKDMSPEEKGALLLAHHEGKTIQYYCPEGEVGWLNVEDPIWTPNSIYRIKPEPKIVKKSFFYNQGKDTICIRHCATHTISFNIVDGEVDCSSVKMEKM